MDMKTAAQTALPASVRLLENLLHRTPQADATGSRFLIPQFQTALGTILHATPLVEALHHSHHDCRIIIAGGQLASEVYRNHPHVERIVAIPSPTKAFRQAVASGRAAHFFDGAPCTTLLTTGNERTPILLWSAAVARSQRRGFAVLPGLVHRHHTFDPGLGQIANNLHLADAIDPNASPRMYPSTGDVKAAEALLLQRGASPAKRRIAFVTQTSVTQHKQWPQDRFIALARTLIDNHNADLIFVGTASEREQIESLRTAISRPTINVAGDTGISELAAIFTRCDLGVTLDTGPLHVGRAVGLPMVIIAPAWSPPHEWLPVHDPRYRILKNATMDAPPPDNYVIDEVSLDEVLSATLDLMRDGAADRDRRTLNAPQQS